MKPNNNIINWLIALSAGITSGITSAIAGSASVPVTLSGQWYQGIDMPNTTLKSLGAKVGDQISFKYPFNGNVSTTWGSISVTNCSTQAQANESITTCTISADNDWSQTLSFGINLASQAQTSGQGSVSVSAGKALNSATINLTLPSKPDFIDNGVMADIIVLENGVQIAEINHQAWNSTLNLPVSFSEKTASFQVLVPKLNGAVGVANPSEAFSLENQESKTVTISYTAPIVEKASVEITAIKNENATASNDAPYRIVNQNGLTVASGHLHWSGITLVNNLETPGGSASFTLNTPSFVDGDTEYSAIGGATRALTLKTNQVLPIKINYQGKPVTTEMIHFNVTGLPMNQQAKISMINQRTKINTEIQINKNGTIDQSIKQNGDPWTLIASNIDGYTSTIDPSSFSANEPTKTIAINYKKLDPSAQGLLVGYLQNDWGTPIKISDAARVGYNVQVIAFSKASIPDQTPLSDKNQLPLWEFGDNVFLPYTKNWSPMTPEYASDIRNDILLAKQKYGLKYVLISVGGQNGTVNLTGKNIENMAQNIRDFLNYYTLDGVDFDLENNLDGKLLDQLIKAIKSAPLANGKTAIISAAPQLNGVNQITDVILVTTGTSQDYKIAVENGDFDYLFLQDYNTGANSNVIYYNHQAIDETMSNYIIASYYYLIGKSDTKQTLIYIPSNTLLVPGEPANAASGGQATVFNNGSTHVYQDMASSYQSLVGQSQFGGAMTWSINNDVATQCQFAKAMSPVITGNTSSFCP